MVFNKEHETMKFDGNHAPTISSMLAEKLWVKANLGFFDSMNYSERIWQFVHPPNITQLIPYRDGLVSFQPAGNTF